MFRILPIALALIIGFQPLGEAFFYLWYVVDNASFTETFCINKEKPELECHGQCHMAMISEMETGGHDAPAAPAQDLQKPQSRDTCLPPKALSKEDFSCFTTIERSFEHPDWRETLLARSIFHPPERG